MCKVMGNDFTRDTCPIPVIVRVVAVKHVEGHGPIPYSSASDKTPTVAKPAKAIASTLDRGTTSYEMTL